RRETIRSSAVTSPNRRYSAVPAEAAVCNHSHCKYILLRLCGELSSVVNSQCNALNSFFQAARRFRSLTKLRLREVFMRHSACSTLSCAVLLVLTLTFTPAWSQANVTGIWSTMPYTMPINPVHVALLNNSKVLVVSGSGNVAGNTNFQAAVWDPQAGTITTQPVAWDMFCNGMVVLPDGRPLINGGTLQYDPFHGALNNSLYDPATNTFSDIQNMAHGRWYPTTTVLGDGRVLTFSGLDENGNTSTTVEIYTVGAGWSSAYAAGWTPPLYPRLHVLPNGKVFYSGSTTQSRTFDPATHQWANVATTRYSGTRTYGTSVLLPLTASNNYAPRVLI